MVGEPGSWLLPVELLGPSPGSENLRGNGVGLPEGRVGSAPARGFLCQLSLLTHPSLDSSLLILSPPSGSGQGLPLLSRGTQEGPCLSQ